MKALPEHPCSACGVTAPRSKRLAEGGGLCRPCYNVSRREECSRCNRLRTPSTRTGDGAPLCGYCARPKRACARCGRVDHVTAVVDGDDYCQRCHQAPVRACGRCGKERPIAARSQNGTTDLCGSCYQTNERECAVCHLTQPVHVTSWPIGPVCTGCYRRVLRTPSTCPNCDQVKVLIGSSGTGERICGPCAGATRDYVCALCGAAGDQHLEQTCIRCSVTRIVGQLLSAATGTIPDSLTELPDALARRGRPDSTIRWLLKPIPKALLQNIGAETSVTHASLDACPPGQARHHLRSLLIDAGILPLRDEHTERLGTWVDELVATLPPHHAAVIGPYANWKVLRTVRRRTRRKRTSIGVASSARERIRAAVRLLRHLDQDDTCIAVLTQDTLDRWTNGSRSRSSDIAPFIHWLNISGVTEALRVEVQKATDPSEINPEELQRTLIRELISGQTPADLATRVAGLLILLYGARTESIHRLTTADISTEEGRTYLAIARDPLELPLPVAQLIGQLAAVAERSPRAQTRTGESGYLFASSRRSHEPIHPTTLGRKLARAGIRPQISRNSAMLTLASDLPAAVVAIQMGLTAQTATKWAGLSQRDGSEYLLARTERET